MKINQVRWCTDTFSIRYEQYVGIRCHMAKWQINVKPSNVPLETFVLLKEKLCDYMYYILYWSERIKTFSKMDTYCLLKQRFGLENYISDLKKERTV